MTKGHFEDLTGLRYGRLAVIERAANRNKHVYWLCQCDCGERVEVRADGLTRGSSVSCGCYQHEIVTKHGMWNTAAYKTWRGMLLRCKTSSHPAYPRYGGRGIKVCERWHDFLAFYADMYPKPFKTASLDRIDNEGDYCPENCRWATKKEQSRNRSDNRVLNYYGTERCVTEWAETLGMKVSALSMRLRKGWTVEDALETPVYLGNRWRRKQSASA